MSSLKEDKKLIKELKEVIRRKTVYINKLLKERDDKVEQLKKKNCGLIANKKSLILCKTIKPSSSMKCKNCENTDKVFLGKEEKRGV